MVNPARKALATAILLPILPERFFADHMR